MSRLGRMIIQDKLSRGRDRMHGDMGNEDMARGRRDGASGADYASGYRDGFMDAATYEIKGEYDHMGDMRDMADQADMARRRSRRTGRFISDGHSKFKLEPQDIKKWESMLVNADGTKGKHFDMHQVTDAASKLGIRFDKYSEKEFCMAMNMLYSDLCEVCRAYVSPDKEAWYYAKMAQAWLEDDDGPEPSEKLALYYHCIADNE